MANRLHISTRVLTIGAVAVAMGVGIVVLVQILTGLGHGPEHPPATPMASPHPPIPAEARPFRPGPAHWEVDAAQARRHWTHPRNLEFSRRVRAYPGAPPRIPHGLTDEEHRLGICTICHTQGGFAPRFGAYAPVTPHPELTDCLQCHAPDARTVGIEPGLPTPDGTCLQCHVDPDAPDPSFVTLSWVPMTWPELDRRAMSESPPWIPHTLHFRENCVACHAGPSAVHEIRTTHPQRTDCRSCHVPTRVDHEVFPGVPEGAGFTLGGSR